MSVHICHGVHVEVREQSVFSYRVCSGDQTRVFRIGDGPLPLSHLAGPGFFAMDQESLESTLDYQTIASLPNQRR